MKKFILLFFITFVMTAIISAQTPSYYNTNAGTINNMFPLNVSSGKMVQLVVPPNTFTQPSVVPAGSITKLYFYINSTYPLGPAYYTSFKICLQQMTDSVLTSGAFNTGSWDTVYKRDTVTLTAAASTWLMFTLDHSFTYDPTKSLGIQIEQCSVTGTYTGYSLTFTSATGYRRNFSVGGCPFVYSGVSTAIINCGVDVESPSVLLPDLLYYKFLNNPSATTVLNYASPGVGNNPATLTSLTLTSGGEFDSCLSGTATSSAKIATGYSLSTGTSSFTISMWLSELVTPSTTRYLFGDAGLLFRCFVGGVAPTNGAVLRGTGVTDVPINNIFPGPTVIHIVYDSAASAVKIYKNGVLDNTVSQTAFNFTSGTGFSVGGYSSSAGLEGKMDEFRFYKRALSQSEIDSTWNKNLGVTVTGVKTISSEIPSNYSLSQNYPNPFNPVTKINFDLPKNGLVTLRIYDVLGREVKTLVNEVKNAGKYIVDFNGSSFSSGTYFYRLESNGYVVTKKMMLIK
jgi:hypothetical protein